ncbi:MAG: TolC family protein [Verrucomicrobiota bacterium]|nr:TolC family protein [Verrucomicrobiota bacterium]
MRKIFYILPFLFITTIWYGCMPSHTKPVDPLAGSEIPVEWEALDQNISVSNDQNVTYWMDSFENKWLNEAVFTAWSANPSLVAMAEQTLARGEEAVIAGASILPQANVGMNGSRSKRNLIGFGFPNGSTSFTTESFSSGINLSWEIDLWGKLRDQRNSAKKRFEGAQADYEGARLSLAGQVARAWYGIVESEQQLELAEQMTETFEKNQAFIANRFVNGLASSLENDLATSALASSQATETMRERVRNAQIKELESFLGAYPKGDVDRNFSETLPELALAPLPPTPAQAMENRPDLQAARLQLEASGYDLSAAKMNLLPSFSLSGGPGSRSEEFVDLLDNRFRTWEISGSVTQPLFNGGRIRANIRRSEALRKAAEANYRAVALRAFTEAENLLANEIFLQMEENYLKNASMAAQTAAKTSWDRYQRGVQGIFDTLESQRRAFDAESRLLSSRKERIFNRINLFLALGTPALPTEP